MTVFSIVEASAPQLLAGLDLLKAMRRCAAVVAVLLFTSVPMSAAESPVIAPGAKLEALGEGYAYAYGPAADREGNVFFTDPFGNRIVKWHAADGTFSDWLTPSGYAKGLDFDNEGNLVAVTVEKGELWSITPDKSVAVLATNFGGKQFNGPNDLWIRSDGGVYFTDPYYRTSFLIRDPTKRMAGQHVYFLAPDRKTVTQVTTDLFYPYGIMGTADDKLLYVADGVGLTTWVYDIQANGELANKRVFYDRVSEGMTIDAEGNVYLTKKGVTVVDKMGKKIEQIDVPVGLTTDVTFGGKDRNLLFITTTDKYVYGLRMRVKGVR